MKRSPWTVDIRQLVLYARPTHIVQQKVRKKDSNNFFWMEVFVVLDLKNQICLKACKNLKDKGPTAQRHYNILKGLILRTTRQKRLKCLVLVDI